MRSLGRELDLDRPTPAGDLGDDVGPAAAVAAVAGSVNVDAVAQAAFGCLEAPALALRQDTRARVLALELGDEVRASDFLCKRWV